MKSPKIVRKIASPKIILKIIEVILSSIILGCIGVTFCCHVQPPTSAANVTREPIAHYCNADSCGHAFIPRSELEGVQLCAYFNNKLINALGQGFNLFVAGTALAFTGILLVLLAFDVDEKQQRCWKMVELVGTTACLTLYIIATGVGLYYGFGWKISGNTILDPEKCYEVSWKVAGILEAVNMILYGASLIIFLVRDFKAEKKSESRFENFERKAHWKDEGYDY